MHKKGGHLKSYWSKVEHLYTGPYAVTSEELMTMWQAHRLLFSQTIADDHPVIVLSALIMRVVKQIDEMPLTAFRACLDPHAAFHSTLFAG